jgi:hypothetical protein
MNPVNNKNNLFNNPMVDSAMKALSTEQLEKYKIMGDYIHGTNFEEKTPQPLNIEDSLRDGIFYIDQAIKSGLHPTELSHREVQLMTDIYGSEWYINYGYDKDDVHGLHPTINNRDTILNKKQIKQIEKKNRRKNIRESGGNPKKNKLYSKK